MAKKDNQGITVDPSRLKRDKPPLSVADDRPEPMSVSAGPVDKALELAFNANRDKIREVTIIDRMQGRMFPQLDMIDTLRSYCIEIAYYRMDAKKYTEAFGKPYPVAPNALEELLHRTAQWQKSVEGINLGKLTEIAMAEMESRSTEDDDIDGGNKDPFAKE